MTPSSTALVVRAVSLYVPILLALALALHGRPDRRRVAGAVLATAWNLPALLAVNLLAVRAGWWSFDAGTAEVAGVPADLWIGWALLWGAVPLLATTRLAVAGTTLVLADLVLMPLAEPVVVLERSWLVGEATAVAACLLPGLLLGRWTAREARLGSRTLLQLVAFTGLVFFVVPTLCFAVTGQGWAPLLDRPRWHLLLAGVLLAPVGAMAVQAVREFAAHGGTPIPLDPPPSLVRTGPYAYVANPMQVAGTILLAAWGVLLSSAAVMAAAVVAAAFSAGFARWNEGGELQERFGEAWPAYRRRVRTWLPHWRPAVFERAAVFVAATCEPCRQVGGFLAGRRPVRLAVRAAEGCPFPLERITYQRTQPPGARGAAPTPETGIAALGRSLEHVNLAWAAASWIARLPVVAQVLQLISDVVIGSPGSNAEAGAGPASSAAGAPWRAS